MERGDNEVKNKMGEVRKPCMMPKERKATATDMEGG